MNEQEYGDLVGPRSDERGERELGDVDKNGTDLWVAFLDPNALVDRSGDAQDAKNAFTAFKAENPEIVEKYKKGTLDEFRKAITVCKHKSPEECDEIMRSSGPAQAA